MLHVINYGDFYSTCLVLSVRPDEVVGKSIPGINVSIIYCPTDFAFQQLESHPDLSKFQTDNSSQNCKDESQLFEVMIHITPSELCKSESYIKWMKRFGSCVEHVILNSGNEFPGSSIENISIDQSPFREYQLDCLGKLSPNISKSKDATLYFKTCL